MTKTVWRLGVGLCVLALAVGCQPSSPPARNKSAATSSGSSSKTDADKGEQGENKPGDKSSVVLDSDKKDDKAADAGEIDKKAAAEGPFKFGDLIAPFTPPTLAELDAKAEWIDQPVVDALKLLREQQAKRTPLVTVDEALALRNNSETDNAKILSALGRLPDKPEDVNWDAAIIRHAYGDVNSTNPLLASSVVEADILSLVGFGLFGFDADFNAFAAADTAVSWQTSKDGMYDKVVMRKDLVWSDGKPITAHDVVFSFKTIMTSKVPVTAMRSGTDKLKWIEAYDDHTLVFFQKQPYATNKWNLNFAVIPKHVYEPTLEKDPTLVNLPEHVKLEDNPVSGGPYVFSSRSRGQEIVLEARENWYMFEGKQVRDKPYFKTIRFRIRPDLSVALLGLKAGDIDEMQLTPEMWKTQTDNDDFYKVNTRAHGLEWTEFHFLWNCQDPLFSDKRVRTAMSYAMDYEELLTRLRYGIDKPCNGVFHPTSKWATKPALPFFKQDLDKAEELLAEAGWEDTDSDGVLDKVINGKKTDFNFTVLVTTRQDRIDICSLLKESLEQLQIKVSIKPLEFPVMIDKMQKHDFQAAFGGWGTGTDPYTLENIFKTQEERNYGQYSNAEVDKLFEAGMVELDENKRAEIYGKIQKILFDEQPYTWLFYQEAFYGFNRSLRGYNFSPRGPYHYSPGFGSMWKPVAK